MQLAESMLDDLTDIISKNRNNCTGHCFPLETCENVPGYVPERTASSGRRRVLHLGVPDVFGLLQKDSPPPAQGGDCSS